LSDNLSDEHSRQIAEQIREGLARRRISRAELADQAKISISSLEKALSGRRPFTLATTIRLEEALGISLRLKKAAAVEPGPNLAPADPGSYSRPAVSWIEGNYLTLRPSFGRRKAIFAYRTEILWDGLRPSLVFRDSERLDAKFSQAGAVAVPNQSGHIYLVTSLHGNIASSSSRGRRSRARWMVLLRPCRSDAACSSSQSRHPSHCCRLPRSGTFNSAKSYDTDPCYATYQQYLQRTVDEEFVVFVPP
jgi:transcriptional regulator with XRE-family HTH domain